MVQYFSCCRKKRLCAMFRKCFLLLFVIATKAEREGFIVGGNFASIYNYPHSAFLMVYCVERWKPSTHWVCGGSVLNQQLLLTAGHCVEFCLAGTRIIAHVGDSNREKGVVKKSSGFILHEKYDSVSISFDIALIRLNEPLELSSKISRVAIMKKPPYNETAYMAGWGVVDEVTFAEQDKLKHIDQRVWKYSACLKKMYQIPNGTICATSKNLNDMAAEGDSGSALVVRGYIQIGLVSYKDPHISRSLIVYTDVGYHYNWIVQNAKKLYCHDSIMYG